jgi:WD40 repeat protein
MLTWKAHTGKVRCLAFSQDGALLVSVADAVKTMCLWDPSTGKKVRELRDQWLTWGAAFSPDGRFLATTLEVFRVVLWDRLTWQPVAELYHSDTRYGPAFAPDSSSVVAAGPCGVALWTDPGRPAPKSIAAFPKDCRKPNRVFGHQQRHKFDSVQFSPDGRFIAANGEARAMVWDVATKKMIRKFDHHPTPVLTSVAFSPDGGRLAVGHAKQVDVWPIEGDGPPVTCRGHTLFVRGVGFSQDGRSLLTAGSDGSVRVWDASTGAQQKSFDWGIGRLYSVAFSPDGLTCAAGGEKGQVVVWDVDA